MPPKGLMKINSCVNYFHKLFVCCRVYLLLLKYALEACDFTVIQVF